MGAGGRRPLSKSRFFNLAGINPNFSLGNGLYVVTNGATSNYNALQVQFQRPLSTDFPALASYTWSHSLDDLSSNFASYEPPIRGNSDFDIRNNFAAGLTYDFPGSYSNAHRRAAALETHWALDGQITVRSALPVDITSGIALLSNGMQQYVRPDVVSGVPVYVPNPAAPRGRRVNANAFEAICPAWPRG